MVTCVIYTIVTYYYDILLIGEIENPKTED